MKARLRPDYLIIGAMKSGTTSLFFDLGAHPKVYLPPDKEPHVLAPEAYHSGTPPTYRSLLARARADQICGDASTGYSKLPDVGDVPERAFELAGPALKIVYLVREPVARLMSQHYHELTDGTAEHRNVDVAVRRTARLIRYGLYAYQIRPWVMRFGASQVRLVQFERYVAERESTVRDVLSFLGLDPAEMGSLPTQDVNSASRAVSKRGPVWRASRGRLYRAMIRPLLSRRARAAVKRRLLPAPPPPAAPPSMETVDYILEHAARDAEALPSLVDVSTPVPRWDFQAVRARYESVDTESR